MEPGTPLFGDANLEPAKKTRVFPTKLEAVLGIILLIILALGFIWALPAYKQVIVQRDNYKAQVDKLSSNTETETYYPNGNIQTRTVIKLVHDTSTVDTSRDYSKTTEKRGNVGVGLGLNALGDTLVVGRATVLGPLGVGVLVDPVNIRQSSGFLEVSF